MTEAEAAAFESAVLRREAHEPFQLIAGRKEFYGFDFEVEAGVLIPRPETELLVERSIAILEKMDRPHIFEAGVGTGCISVSILHAVMAARATAVDVSMAALRLAARNARRHGVFERLNLINSDLFTCVSDRFEMIVSNPPYIPLADAEMLQPEVVNYDPPEALFAGEDGLDVIRRLIADAPSYLANNGYLLMEIGYGQDESVRELFRSNEWAQVEIFPDLQGIPRTVVARLGVRP